MSANFVAIWSLTRNILSFHSLLNERGCAKSDNKC